MTGNFAIAELKDTETGGFCPRGAARELWLSKDHEILLSGPAETGKTWGALQKLDTLLWRYPGATAAIVRKTLTSIHGSALRTYGRIIGDDSPIRPYGGEKPEWFDYPNKSRLYVGGMDKPGKVLSSERDFICVIQAEELEIEDWETLLTRSTGRGGVAPYSQLFGDCNPGPPTHWIKKRSTLKLLNSHHEDNPTLYDDAGHITEQGRISLSILDALTGIRKERLRYGRWAAAEGIIYEGYDPSIHLINRFPIPREWPRYWVVDFGFTHPFVWQAWAEDPDGRLYRYREIYHTKTLVEDHAETIRNETKGEPRPRALICDHDAEDRATLERKLGITTQPARKGVSDGIQAMASRLRVQPDGKARIFFMRDSLVKEDSELAAARKPTCSEQEIETYIWDTGKGQKKGEQPLKQGDHGMDTSRYMVAWVDLAAGNTKAALMAAAAATRPRADDSIFSNIPMGRW